MILQNQNALFEKLTDKVSSIGKTVGQTDDHESSHMKLPKIQLGPFYGEIDDWPRFYSAFKAEVDENPKLHFSSKYNYLHALIKSKAKDAIKGLPYTLEGY